MSAKKLDLLEKKLKIAIKALTVISNKNAMFANELAMKDEALRALSLVDAIDYLEE